MCSIAYGEGVKQAIRIIRGAVDRCDTVTPGTQVEVSVFGELKPARILPGAPYDPHNTRLRS